MAALGGTEVLPYEDGAFFIAYREDFYSPPEPTYAWGTCGLPYHEYLYGWTFPTSGQVWPISVG